MAEWVASFPKVRLNLVADSTGDWLCWVVLRGYGTVLWRESSQLGHGSLVTMAYRTAKLPMVDGKLPAHAHLFAVCLSLEKLEKHLREVEEDRIAAEIAPPPRTRKDKKPAAHSRSTLQETAQHTLNFAAH